MLLSADWVLPVSRPPIRNGAVLLRRSRILEVGEAAELAERHPRATRHDFPDCVLMPGLVNAHTHLSLTALDGLLEPAPFAEWLSRVVLALRALDHDDLSASAALGALRCVSAGVTVVGDVAYGPEAPAAAADAGVGGVFYWEILGISRSELPERLAELEFPTDPAQGCTGRLRCGLSPHAAYSSGPDLIRTVRDAARVGDLPFAMHVAESAAEARLLVRGDGPLESVARRLALGFRPPRSSSVAYLDRLGALDGAVAVHCATLSPNDPQRLARTVRGVVLCPRSNAFLGNGPAPVADLDHAGLSLALGTDSSASNEDLDLFAEARALRALYPAFGPKRVLEIVTKEGARVLGVEDSFGSLAPDMQADLVAICTGQTAFPEEAVLAEGGPDTVTAVISGGIWRLLDGSPVFPTNMTETAAAKASARARAALHGATGPGRGYNSPG